MRRVQANHADSDCLAGLVLGRQKRRRGLSRQGREPAVSQGGLFGRDESLYFDLALTLPNLGEVKRELQTKPQPRIGPSGLLEANGHLWEDSSLSVDDARQSWTGYAQNLRAGRHA